MPALRRLVLLGFSFSILTACHLTSAAPASPSITPPPSPTISTAIVASPTIPPQAVLTNYLVNAHLVGLDTFDNPSGWTLPDEISNGRLLLRGLGGSNWHGLSNRAIFQEDNGVIINFQFTPGEFFEMYFEQGPWTTRLYKRFGVYVNQDHSNANLFVGRQRTDFHLLAGNLSLEPATWYSLLMAVGRDGNFLAVIWDPTNPGNNLQYRAVIENWKGLDWAFRIQVNQGLILFDDFEEVVFDDMK